MEGGSSQVPVTYQPIIHCHHIRQAASIKVAHDLSDPKVKHLGIIPVSKEFEEQKLLPPKRRVKSYPKYARKAKEKDSGRIKVTNKRTKVIFRFIYHPEYLEQGSAIVISDQTLRAFGVITKIFYDT